MDVLDSHKSKTATSIDCIGTMQDVDDFTSLCVNSDTVMMSMFSTEGPQPLYRQFLLIFVKMVNSHNWTDWFAKNSGNMPGLHWHLYISLERIFNLLADFLKNFTNINVVLTMGRPISELKTSSLTKALRVMKAFLTQVDLAQSTNTPVVFGRGSIYKYEVNPVNNMKVCPPSFDYEGASHANTHNSRRAEAPKHDSTVPPTDGNERAPADQGLKKPHCSSAVADSTKCNVSEMGMFFLNKPNMKALDIFPNGLIQSVCANFACKGRECTRKNCAFVHPRKVGDLKKETVNAIGDHFLDKKIGWFNEWHFLKVKHKLPEKFKSLMGGKDGCSSKMD